MLAARSAISAEGGPERDAGRDRGQGVGQVVGLGEGELEALRARRGRDQASVTPSATLCSMASTSPPGPKRTRLGAPRQVRLELPGVDRDHRDAAGGQRLEHLRLGRGHRLDRAEQLDVDRADVGDHRRRPAPRSRPARRSARRPASPSPAPASRCPRGAERIGQRQADLGVEVLAVGVDPARAAATGRCP